MFRILSILFVSMLAFLLPESVLAQYMYLDANGDGVRTDQDLMPTSGSVDVDIWIVTNADRNGSSSVCDTGDGDFTINSYVVNLRAVGGTVIWGPYQDWFNPRSLGLRVHQDSTEFQAVQTSDPLPAGRYRLGTLRITASTGTPWIDVVRNSPFSNEPTSFGSSCSGLDYENTLKLGTDWFDADGLESDASNSPPFIDPIADLTMDENAMGNVHVIAGDPDGDDLTLTLVRAPVFATVTTTSSPGRLDADVVFTPGYANAGSYPITAQVTDGGHRREEPFLLTVRNVNRSPTLAAIPDTSMEIGAVLTIAIQALDPDGPVTVTAIEKPSFATLSSPQQLTFRPGLQDSGTYGVRVAATDGFETVTVSFQIRVTDSGLHGPPVFDPIPEITLEEGQFDYVNIRAYAPDGMVPSLRLVQAPAYVSLQTDPFSSEFAWGRLLFSPGARDSGTAIVKLEAATSLYSTTYQFNVYVRAKNFEPVLFPMDFCVEPGERRFVPLYVRAPELDSTRLSVGPLPAWISYVAAAPSSRPGFWLTTGPEDPPRTVPIDVYLNQGTSSEWHWSVTASIVGYDQCPENDPYGVQMPVPDIGGPYSGVAGAAVSFRATSTDPHGTVDRYRWTFGDGHAALGAAVTHVYAEAGTYRAVVRVSPFPESRDSASVVISDAYPARVLFGDSEIRLADRGDLCVSVAGMGDAYDLADLDLATVSLWIRRGVTTDSIPAQHARSALIRGEDNSPRLHTCFSRRSLDRFLSRVGRRDRAEMWIQARLQNGARVRAPLRLAVSSRLGGWGTVVIRPNPLNPAGTISFDMRRSGRVRALIYDVSGRLVRILWDGPLPEGPVDLPFDGRNSRGETLGSGVYYYRIVTPDQDRSGRLTILK